MSTAIETTQTIETTAPVEVKLTEETTELKISAARAAQAKDIYWNAARSLHSIVQILIPLGNRTLIS